MVAGSTARATGRACQGRRSLAWAWARVKRKVSTYRGALKDDRDAYRPVGPGARARPDPRRAPSRHLADPAARRLIAGAGGSVAPARARPRGEPDPGPGRRASHG